mgnify:CR=1 FL=1
MIDRSRAAPVAAAGAGASAEEVRRLRQENEQVVSQLVAKTMELAQQSENEITLKRELARLREVNMKLADKATSLEAQAAQMQMQMQAMMLQASAAGKKGKK